MVRLSEPATARTPGTAFTLVRTVGAKASPVF